MRRLAYVCTDPGIPVFGTKGASVHVQEVVRAFRALGWIVTVYCTRRGDLVPDDLADLEVHELGPTHRDPAAREAELADVGVRLAAQAVADGADLVYERYSLFTSAGATVAEALGCPLVVEVNAPLLEEQAAHRVLVDAERAWAATCRTFDAADSLVCVSEPVAGWVRSVVDDPARVHVVANGVNTRRIRPAMTGGTDDRGFTVGFVGTLKPWHGVDVLVRAFATAAGPDWRLLVCGDGPERDVLERLARDLGARVDFTGAVAPEHVPDHLASMDVAVAPYPDAPGHYFSPLKVYEYLAAGLPVVASRIGQTEEVLDHDTTGLLVAPGDADALAAALCALRQDPARRRRLGSAGRRLVEDEHGWDRVVDRVLATLPAGIVR